jgi:UDP-N-acetylglucosamine 2-epimerase
MRRILTVIGARPQFIKAAPVSKALKSFSDIEEIIVHTGQHYDKNMSDIFFNEMGIPEPDHNLDVGSGSHAVQTGEIMLKLEKVLIREKPGLVLIYGDTNSTLAGAIAAAKLNIPIAHVEAGLRSFNRKMPEEVNRIVADRLSSLLFCPTQTAVENLAKEGITDNVYKTGDVMYDACMQFIKTARENSEILSRLELKNDNYILVTVHRPENTDDKVKLTNIFKALSILNKRTPVVFPVHPRTRKAAVKYEIDEFLDDMKAIKPVGFLDMVMLEKNARLIMTDSGGMQKEAYFHEKPCVTLREQTEWVETIKAGWNVLADANDIDSIVDAAEYKGKQDAILEYGTGKAAEIVSDVVRGFVS